MKKILSSGLLFFICSCSLLGKKEEQKKGELTVNVDSTIMYKDQTLEAKAASSTPIPDSSFIIQAPGYMPLYVITMQDKFNKNEINMLKINSEYIGKDLNNILRGNLSDALYKIHEIQGDLYQKKADQALNKIQDFEKEYGKVGFISYLKATAYYLKRDSGEALATLNSLSDAEKENKMVKSFLQRLKQ